MALSQRQRQVIRWVVTAIIVSLAAILFGRTIADNWTEVHRVGLHPAWQYGVAILLFALAVPLSGALWVAVLRRLGPDARFSTREGIAVSCASWLLKYIPGQVGSFVNKVDWGKRRGISRLLIGITFVYENVFLQLASLIPGVAILLVVLGADVFADNLTLLVLPLVVIVPLLLVSQRRVFRALVAPLAQRVLKAPAPDAYFLSTRDTLLLQFGYLGPRILNGAGFVLIVAATNDVSATDWPQLAAAYVLAGAIGILAVFVPSGIGVREAVIVALVSPALGITQAVIVSVAARLLSTLADVVVAGMYAGIRNARPEGTDT